MFYVMANKSTDNVVYCKDCLTVEDAEKYFTELYPNWEEKHYVETMDNWVEKHYVEPENEFED